MYNDKINKNIYINGEKKFGRLKKFILKVNMKYYFLNHD